MKLTPEAIRDITTAVGGTEPPATPNTIEALKQLYAALGGEDDVSEITTIPDMLEMIATVATGGGGGGGGGGDEWEEMLKGVLDGSIENLVVPEGVTYIRNGVEASEAPTPTLGNYVGLFYNNQSLKSVEFPDGFTDVGNGTFAGCLGLESVTFRTLEYIGKFAFRSCNQLTEIIFPEGLENIDEYAFASCSLENVSFPSTLNAIGEGAFADNFFTALDLSKGVKRIGKMFVTGCNNLTEVYLPAGILSIDSVAFNSGFTGTIYCAFSEGAVSGAPWGANNATIVYDWSPSSD